MESFFASLQLVDNGIIITCIASIFTLDGSSGMIMYLPGIRIESGGNVSIFGL